MLARSVAARYDRSGDRAFHPMALLQQKTLSWVKSGPNPGAGLKVPSAVRSDKLATLGRSMIAGKLGAAHASRLAAQCVIFFDVFGCRQP